MPKISSGNSVQKAVYNNLKNGNFSIAIKTSLNNVCKNQSLYTVFNSSLLSFIHRYLEVFSSVNYVFLPALHSTNNNNKQIYKYIVTYKGGKL